MVAIKAASVPSMHRQPTAVWTIQAVMWLGLWSIAGRAVDYFTVLGDGLPSRMKDYAVTSPEVWGVVWLITGGVLALGLVAGNAHVTSIGCFAAAVAYGATAYVQAVDVIGHPEFFEIRWAVEAGIRSATWAVLMLAMLQKAAVIDLWSEVSAGGQS